MRRPYRVDYQFNCSPPCNSPNLDKTFVDAEDAAEARQLALARVHCSKCRSKVPPALWHHVATQVIEATDADLEF
jgi:hypothetical protein